MSFDDRKGQGVVIDGTDRNLFIIRKDIRSALCGRTVLLNVLCGYGQLVNPVFQRGQRLTDMGISYFVTLSDPLFDVSITVFFGKRGIRLGLQSGIIPVREVAFKTWIL